MNPHIREILRYSFLVLAGYMLLFKEMWEYGIYLVILAFLFMGAEVFFYGGNALPKAKESATNVKIIYAWITFLAIMVVAYFFER